MGCCKICSPHEKPISAKTHVREVEALTYQHGTHFVFLESMIKTMLPIGSGLFVKLALHAAREYPKECKTTREDIDRRISKVLEEWRQ